MENIAQLLTFPRAVIHTLTPQEGFAEVASAITQGDITVAKFKIIVLLFGRADLWSVDKNFRTGVAACLQTIRLINKNAIITLCAFLPSPGDSNEVKRTSAYRHSYMSFLAGDANKLEFSKPGKFLLHNGNAVSSFFDNRGLITERGLDQIRRALEAKIRCANMFHKFEEYFSDIE